MRSEHCFAAVGHRHQLSLDEETVTCLARNVVVPVDLMSANIHFKLNRAIERQRPAAVTTG